MGIQLNITTAWIETIRDRAYPARHRLATVGIGLLLLVVGYHVLFGVNGIMAYQQQRKESRDLQQEIESLKHQNEQLEQQIKALKYDPQAIEKEAREKLRYVRPGEMVYTVPLAKSAATQSPDRK